jgi:hypothetical protein
VPNLCKLGTIRLGHLYKVSHRRHSPPASLYALVEFRLPKHVEYRFLGRAAPSDRVEHKVTKIRGRRAPDSGCVAKQDEAIAHPKITHVGRAKDGLRRKHLIPELAPDA